MFRGGKIVGLVLAIALVFASPAFALLVTPPVAPMHHCCPKTATMGAHMPMPSCPCCADSKGQQAPPSVLQVPVTHAKAEPAQAASAAVVVVSDARQLNVEQVLISSALHSQAVLCTFLI